MFHILIVSADLSAFPFVYHALQEVVALIYLRKFPVAPGLCRFQFAGHVVRVISLGDHIVRTVVPSEGSVPVDTRFVGGQDAGIYVVDVRGQLAFFRQIVVRCDLRQRFSVEVIVAGEQYRNQDDTCDLF